MKTRGFLGALLLSLSSTALVQAQALPPASGSPYAHSSPPASASQAGTAGNMPNTLTKPVNFVSGGILPSLYAETPSEAELKKVLGPGSTASQAEKLAAKIKYDEASTAARRAAVHYLGTVDCRIYPEVEDALIAVLRGDRNESVRCEAALALSNACCFSKKTMAALLIVVNGTDSDGKRAETADRVKTLAMKALEHSPYRQSNQAASPKPPQVLPQPKEKLDSARNATTGVQLATYQTQNVADRQTAQKADETSRHMAETASTSPATRALPTWQHNIASPPATLAAPVNVLENRAFDEAVQTLLDMRQPSPPPPAPAGTPAAQRVGAARPARLMGPSPLLNPEQ
jgi:hypothetical protein